MEALEETLGEAGGAGANASAGNLTDGACGAAMLPAVYFVTQIVYAAVCVAGLLGNTLVIYVVLRYSKMQTVTNLYIVNLAVADECFLIGIPFLIVTMALRSWPFGRFMCKAYMVSTGVNQFTSSIFLCIMSADRYIAVCHPVAAPRLRTPLVSRAVAAAAWTTSAILMAPLVLYTNLVPTEHGVSCNVVWPERNPQRGQAAFIHYTFVLGFAAPLALIFVFYCLVIRKLRTVGPKNRSKEKKRSHRKVTRLVLTVITVYVLCWLPYWAFQVTLIYSPHEECASRVTVAVFLVAACFSYSNSAVNPVLYAFLSDNFKKSFLKACACVAGKDVDAALRAEPSALAARRGARRTVGYAGEAGEPLNASSCRGAPQLAVVGVVGSDPSTALTSRSPAGSDVIPLHAAPAPLDTLAPSLPFNGNARTAL